MSGGLEVAAGVIAIVQVAGQAAFLITKIKALWVEVRDAPDEIQDLLDEVELTSLTLQSIEQQVQQSKMAGVACGNPALDAVLKHAQGAYQALQKVIDLLDKEIQESRGKTRRFVKSTKVLLKKPVLDRLKNRLEFSLRLLVLSSHIQMSAMVTQSASVIFERLPNPPPESSSAITGVEDDTLAKQAAEDTSEQSQVTHCNITSKRRLRGFNSHQVSQWSWTGRFNFNFSSGDEGWVSIQAPSWLGRSTHVLITSKALGGPQLALRRYEVIKGWDRQVMDSLMSDDWPSLELLLRSRGMSPFVMDMSRRSLVLIACVYKSVRILKRLVDIGLEAQVDDDRASGQFRLSLGFWQHCIFYDSASSPQDCKLTLEIQRILVSHGLDAVYNNFDSLLYVSAYMPVSALQAYLDMFMPSTRTFSPQQTVQLACSLLHSRNDNDISIVLPELKSPPAVSEQPSCIKGSNLMHEMAGDLACLSDESKVNRKVQRRLQWITRCAQEDPQSLFRIERVDHFTYHPFRFEKYVLLGGLSATPLMVFIHCWRSIHIKTSHLHRVSPFQSTFHLFLLSLQDAGVDLASLGRNERQLHFGSIDTRSPVSLYRPELPSTSRLRVFGISFGRRVDDWVLWCAWEYEHFAMEFWNMVENPPCYPPGSWVDEKSEWKSELESSQNYCDLNDETSFVWSEVEEREAGR